MSLSRPTTILVPFATDGDKNTIPVPTQVGITDGAASWETGFPPSTMIDIGVGGIGPDGKDMNGVVFSLSEHIRFINAGGVARFDAALVAEIGGYPVGVEIQEDAGLNSYVNILANNTTNFNTTPVSIGVSWIMCRGPGLVVPQASTTVAGKSEFLTTAELQTGTDETRAVNALTFNACSLGQSQTWQAVTRTAGTTYYNTTGRPIVWMMTNHGNSAPVTPTVGGVSLGEKIGSYGIGSDASVSIIIPHGLSYSFTTSASGITHQELR